MNPLFAAAADIEAFCVAAGRAQDWLDVEGVIARQGTRLSRALVLDELGPLLELKEDDDAAPRLAALFTKHPAR